MNDILIVGDSHTGALNRALETLQETGKPRPNVRVRPLGGGHLFPTEFFKDAGTHAEIIDPLFSRSFPRLPPENMTLGAIGLAAPLWPVRVVRELVWKGQGLAGHHGPHQPVSRAVFRQLVLRDQHYVLKLADLLQRNGLPVLAIASPSLFREFPLLKFHDPRDVMAMFEAYREIMFEELAARGIDAIDIPEGTRDSEGFMRPEFHHIEPEDVHHANADYGLLVLDQVTAWQESLAQRSA